MASRRLLFLGAAAVACAVAGALPAVVSARASAAPVAPDPAWWAPRARLLTLTAAPSRPPDARFASGLAGWTLLGPGGVSVRAGGPGGHYAALRDNTTLETPPLAVGLAQQVVLITARAPVGSPLLHVTALSANGTPHVLGDLRPSASWDTFAFNAAGLTGQSSCSILSWAERTPSTSRAWGRASRSRPACGSCEAPRGGRWASRRAPC